MMIKVDEPDGGTRVEGTVRERGEEENRVTVMESSEVADKD